MVIWPNGNLLSEVEARNILLIRQNEKINAIKKAIKERERRKKEHLKAINSLEQALPTLYSSLDRALAKKKDLKKCKGKKGELG